jgi:hypothetical protein
LFVHAFTTTTDDETCLVVTAFSLFHVYVCVCAALPADNNPGYPWMGMRVRLRASFSCTGLATNLGRMVCTAMKK